MRGEAYEEGMRVEGKWVLRQTNGMEKGAHSSGPFYFLLWSSFLFASGWGPFAGNCWERAVH